MASITDVDMAKTDECPGCLTPVRRMPSVVVAGTNRDPIASGPWWCPMCIQANCVAVARGVDFGDALRRLRESVVALLAA